MAVTQYRSLSREGISEQTIKKSRFIGYASPIESEEDALAYIAHLHELHPMASAIAYGYMAGMQQNVQRFYDSGEPSGTAGMPILDVLKQKDLTNVVCAVVRYYGGIQLGAGGLTRAFSGTGAQAVQAAGLAVWSLSYKMRVRLDYGVWGSAENYLNHSRHLRQEVEFGEDIELNVLLRAEDEAEFISKMQNLTNGRAVPERTADLYWPWETA